MSDQATKNPDNFAWIMSENKFMYAPTRTLFERPAVVRQIGAECAHIVERDHVCSNLAWFPGFDTIIKDKVVEDCELVDHPGNDLFNLYRKPKPLKESADPAKAQFWLDLGFELFGDDLDHILDCLAFKVQFPGEKINHALVLGSYDQGIGKDSWLSPVRRAIGSINWRNISAAHAITGIEKNFTPFLRATVLRISEAHEMGAKRFAFYDSTKDWCAAPPETITIADKNVKEYPIMNAVLPIFTSNHLTDGLYIPPEDRRLYYVWSPRLQGDFTKEFWAEYWKRVKTDGDDEHVAACLMARDLRAFNPGDPPRKTPAWHEAVNANRNPQDNDLSDLLDMTGNYWPFTGEPSRADALTLDLLRRHPNCPNALRELFHDPAKRRTAAHRLEAGGYVSVANPDRSDGQWRINSKRQSVYARRDLSRADQLQAARDMIRFEELRAEPVKDDEEEFA